jgi:hypothetical protein
MTTLIGKVVTCGGGAEQRKASEVAAPISRDRHFWYAFFASLSVLGILHAKSLAAVHLADEGVYERAIVAVVEGRPPASVIGWYYPDVVASLGALASRHIGLHALFIALRCAMRRRDPIASRSGWS